MDNPRNSEYNLGYMVCEHRRYRLGDGNLASIGINKEDYFNWETVGRAIGGRKFTNAQIILPLYLYDHSGISISTRSFVGRAPHAEWDSGQVGYIFTNNSAIREFFHVSKMRAPIQLRAVQQLEDEVRYYNDYLEVGDD